MSNTNQNLEVNDSDDEEENTDSDEELIEMKSYKVVRVGSSPYRRNVTPLTEEQIIILLEKEVNILIEQGWSCIGGVSIIRLAEYQYISMSQAMIKNNKALDEQTKETQELLSKLEEQVKLNGELCKRLFDLKN